MKINSKNDRAFHRANLPSQGICLLRQGKSFTLFALLPCTNPNCKYLSTRVSVGCVPGVIVQVGVEDDENQVGFVCLGVGLVVVAVEATL